MIFYAVSTSVCGCEEDYEKCKDILSLDRNSKPIYPDHEQCMLSMKPRNSVTYCVIISSCCQLALYQHYRSSKLRDWVIQSPLMGENEFDVIIKIKKNLHFLQNTGHPKLLLTFGLI
jgi:hypothetical protein